MPCGGLKIFASSFHGLAPVATFVPSPAGITKAILPQPVAKLKKFSSSLPSVEELEAELAHSLKGEA